MRWQRILAQGMAPDLFSAPMVFSTPAAKSWRPGCSAAPDQFLLLLVSGDVPECFCNREGAKALLAMMLQVAEFGNMAGTPHITIPKSLPVQPECEGEPAVQGPVFFSEGVADVTGIASESLADPAVAPRSPERIKHSTSDPPSASRRGPFTPRNDAAKMSHEKFLGTLNELRTWCANESPEGILALPTGHSSGETASKLKSFVKRQRDQFLNGTRSAECMDALRTVPAMAARIRQWELEGGPQSSPESGPGC